MLALSGEEIASTLDGLLKELNLWDQVQQWYERLLLFQQEAAVKFEAVADASLASADETP